MLGQENISIEKSDYGEDVEFTILFQEKKEEELVKKITEATNARAKISVIERLYFVDKDTSREYSFK
jgi:putative IMPACT (imprinted ancient) family translation regulator